jgi:hypothetical protein
MAKITIGQKSHRSMPNVNKAHHLHTTMKSPPIFDRSTFLSLSERTEYESWLLEAVYAIAEQELFPTWPDAVIYPVGKAKAQFIGWASVYGVIGDWRPRFLETGAPLVFVSAFKILDMLIEWVLERNELSSTFRYQEKMQKLELSLIFPPLIESRIWLKERLIGLYSMLEPLRGTIIHNRHFTAENGAIRVSSSKKNVIGPVVEISAAHLRTLVFTILSTLRYIDGTWYFDDLRERTLRHDLDELVAIHGLPLLGQLRPFHTQVRVYSTDFDPLHVDPMVILSDLAARYINQDCSFDLRILIVKNSVVTDAFFFPWALFSSRSLDWYHGINPENYRTTIPDDINPEHLR